MKDEGFSGRRSPEALDESAPALSPSIRAEKLGDDESPENKGRAPLPAIMTGRSGETEPSLEEKVRLIKVTMSARAQNISILEIGAPARHPRKVKPTTRQADFPKPHCSRTRGGRRRLNLLWSRT
jgi:hypothetical protein